MRSGNWKYLREGNKESPHDLSVDEREQTNFADAQPQKLAELRGQYQTWEERMVSYPKEGS